jgi:hypothetical protein
MTKELYDFHDTFTKFLVEKPWLFANRLRASGNLETYFKACGYEADNIPLIQSPMVMGFYTPEIMDQYKDYFVFFRNGQEGFISEFVFNLQRDLHIFFQLVQLPSATPKTIPEFGVKPVLYCNDINDVVSFIRDSEKFLAKPVEANVGFGIFPK